MLEGGAMAVQADEDVVASTRVRELERREQDLERSLGRKTLENEILKEALDLASQIKPPCGSPRGTRTIPGERHRPTLAVSRSNLTEQTARTAARLRRYHKADCADLLAAIRAAGR
jgi:transposase